MEIGHTEIECTLAAPLSFDSFFRATEGSKLQKWARTLPATIEERMALPRHGLLPKWCATLDAIQSSSPSIESNQGYVSIDGITGLSAEVLKEHLMVLSPWRKGPWKIGEVTIDTEWHSDWKWERIVDALGDLSGKTILDVGCGNGYHAYRMALAGAKIVVGIDPGMLSVVQAQLIQKLAPQVPAWVLPLGIDDMPQNLGRFDLVFSMGVLYHRKSPLEHLLHLKGLLEMGGQLILETLVMPEEFGDLLVPKDRYAKMRNVWFLPSISQLILWLERCGYHSIEVVNENSTSIEEQRSTEWMTNESLEDFLDPTDSTQTVEGYPAPLRVTIKAVR